MVYSRREEGGLRCTRCVGPCAVCASVFFLSGPGRLLQRCSGSASRIAIARTPHGNAANTFVTIGAVVAVAMRPLLAL